MSDHNQHHGHDPHDPDHGQVESAALAAKPILLFLAVLFIATTFVFFVVRGLDWGFRKLDEANQGQSATQVEAGRKLPPEPLLQGAPGKGSTTTKDKPTALPLQEMEQVRKETDKKLDSYGWVDKSGGVARIPIDRAKAVIAEKGLPALLSPTISEEVQRAETVRKQLAVAGSNAGRLINGQGPNRRPVQQTPQQPAPQSAKPQVPQPQQNQQQVQPQKH